MINIWVQEEGSGEAAVRRVRVPRQSGIYAQGRSSDHNNTGGQIQIL